MMSVFVTFCVGIIWYVSLISKIYGSIPHAAQQSTYSYLLPDVDSFTTISVTSPQDCEKLCESITSCVLVNYRFRGHICKLEHFTGPAEISTTNVKTAGYVSWRNELFDKLTSITDQCTNCFQIQSCMVAFKPDECAVFACGKPHKNSFMNVLGNVYTLGGRIMHACLNRNEAMCFLECSRDGFWAGVEDDSGYEDFTINGKSFKLKIVSKLVNKTEALERCANEGASLTNVLTMDKLEFFRGIADKIPGEFWIDLERVGQELTLWTSSDGRNHTIDTSLWYKYNEKKKTCARAYNIRVWQLNDVKCYKTYYYICEKS